MQSSPATPSAPETPAATPVWLLVLVAATVMSLSMGLRQSLGLFLDPINVEAGVSASAFGFAMALQNLVWGISQPFVGVLGDRHGARPVLIGCALLYTVGLLLMATGGPLLGLNLGGGILVGIGIAGTGFGVLLGAVSRAVAPERRVQTVGLVSAAGSLATLVIAPLGQYLIAAHGWREALFAFAAIALSMGLVGALVGRPPPQGAAGARVAQRKQTTSEALREAFSHGGFVAMTVAFFACGFQLMYITTHLPSYLAICGVAPGVSATALGVIGLGNAVGSFAAGQLGARYSQKKLLALIYLMRTIAIVCFLSLPVTPTSTLVFAAAMGLLWLSVAPLVSGLIGKLFGLAHFSTLFGITFLSHQVGAFLGAWLGGLAFDLTGSYGYAWGAMIAIGLAAFTLQWFMDDGVRPDPREEVGGGPASAVPTPA